MEETNQTNEVTVRSAGIRFGAISGAVSVAYFLIMTFAGVDISSGPASWVGWVFGIILVFLAHKYYKDNGDGFMNYSQGIGIAFWMSMISTLISSIVTYIYVKFIDASFIENILTKAREDMEAKGQSEEQIEQGMKFVEMFTVPEMFLVFGIIGGIFITIVIALIVTIFTQKARPEARI